MTQREKREQKLNKVLNALKERLEKDNGNDNFKSDLVSAINMTGFFYGCGRLNDMQTLVKLVFRGLQLGMDENDFLELLADAGDLHYKGDK